MASINLLEYLYKSLPKAYRDLEGSSLYLYNYLSAIVDGGYESVLQDSEDLANLIDPQNCPEDLLQFLYRSFGLTYFPDIAPIYHRRILANLGGIIQRRGTYSCIHFLATAVTGSTIVTAFSRDVVDNHRILTVSVIVTSINQLAELDTEIGLLDRFLADYVPYYIEVVVEGTINFTPLLIYRNDIVVSAVTLDYTLYQDPNQP